MSRLTLDSLSHAELVAIGASWAALANTLLRLVVNVAGRARPLYDGALGAIVSDWTLISISDGVGIWIS